ncbi:MAG: hypothetical protein RBT63_11255 [Bdellovibrionales bacterium]|jgi:hypothetical protein|nr:hypothetical protein [Bdellovibrionales bacterium]
MQSLALSLMLGLTVIGSSALGKTKSAADEIHAMKGCYEVTFEFAETFSRLADHKVKSAPYKESGLEWVELDFDTRNEIHLQHVLLTSEGPLKHWRQEWVRAPKEIWTFEGRVRFDDKDAGVRWTKSSLAKSPSDVWLQRVTQVDDSPRYECAARWVNTGSRGYWECEAAAPLPRREFTKRSDYDILRRRNRHENVTTGWAHEQDNLKLQSVNKVSVAEEKGVNTYRKVDDERCALAKTWWAENKEAWHLIQGEWRGLAKAHSELKIKGMVDGKPLWERLFDWAKAHPKVEASSKDQLRAEVRSILSTHVSDVQ